MLKFYESFTFFSPIVVLKKVKNVESVFRTCTLEVEFIFLFIIFHKL